MMGACGMQGLYAHPGACLEARSRPYPLYYHLSTASGLVIVGRDYD